MTHVGITGTRRGMTERQKTICEEVLNQEYVVSLAHGDCMGADADAHEIAQRLGLIISIHPPTNNQYRAFCENGDTVHKPQHYYVRNRAIVDKCDFLLAFPAEMQEQSASSGGTWWTVHYALSERRPTFIVWPLDSVPTLR